MPTFDSTHLDREALANDPSFNPEPRDVGEAAALFLSLAFEDAVASHTTERVYPGPIGTSTAADEQELIAVANDLMRQLPQYRGAYLARRAVILAGLAQEAFLNQFQDELLAEGRGQPDARGRLEAMKMRERLVEAPKELAGSQVIAGQLLDDAIEVAQARNWLVHPDRKNVPKMAKRGTHTYMAARAVLTAARVAAALADAREVEPDRRVARVLDAEEALSSWAERVNRSIPVPPPGGKGSLLFRG
jgi:hypothetical protein